MVEEILAAGDAVDLLLFISVKKGHQTDLARTIIHDFPHFSDIVFLLGLNGREMHLDELLSGLLSVNCCVFEAEGEVSLEKRGSGVDHGCFTALISLDVVGCGEFRCIWSLAFRIYNYWIIFYFFLILI